MFGNDRLRHILYKQLGGTVKDITGGISREVDNFIAPSLPSDDITILVAKRS